MAGMLPGVELARRRRTNHHSFETSNSRDSIRRHHHHQQQQRFESSTTTTNMDETALKARKRLEEKLRGLNGTSRWSKTQTKMNEAIRSSSSHINDQAQSIMVTERRTKKSLVVVESGGVSSPQLDRKNSLQREVCSICLEEFGSKQQVMNLPCCHRYHSDCLLPWLNAHSSCPYCRTHVNLDSVLKPHPPT